MLEKIRNYFYSQVIDKCIIYNVCNEDPDIDVKLSGLNASSVVCGLTSAGCNAFHYLVEGVKHIDFVDYNANQHALAELKKAVIENGTHDDLWKMFSEGVHPDINSFYQNTLKDSLNNRKVYFWDKNKHFFKKNLIKKSFHDHTMCGGINLSHRLQSKESHEKFEEFFSLSDLTEQEKIYDRYIAPIFEGILAKIFVRLSVSTGMPSRQLKYISTNWAEVYDFLLQRFRRILTSIPAKENYFFHLYFLGKYGRESCPEYLREENFDNIKGNLEKINFHNSSLSDFLHSSQQKRYTHFYLLDHLDWLVDKPKLLMKEWMAILSKSDVGTKIIVRSYFDDMSWLPEIIRDHFHFESDIEAIVKKDRIGIYNKTHLITVVNPAVKAEGGKWQ